MAELSAAPCVHAAMGFEDFQKDSRSKNVLRRGRVHPPCSAHGGNDVRAGLGGQIVKARGDCASRPGEPMKRAIAALAELSSTQLSSNMRTTARGIGKG